MIRMTVKAVMMRKTNVFSLGNYFMHRDSATEIVITFILLDPGAYACILVLVVILSLDVCVRFWRYKKAVVVAEILAGLPVVLIWVCVIYFLDDMGTLVSRSHAIDMLAEDK